MNDPSRIWLDYQCGRYTNHLFEGGTEYVRADIVEAEIAHMRLVMRKCAEAIGDDNDEFGALRMLEVALARKALNDE